MKTRIAFGLLGAALLPAAALRAADAGDNWKAHCASCHGGGGDGQTKMGRRLGAKDLSDPAYQKSFTDDQLFDHLKSGETGADGKTKMKPFGDSLSDDEIRALVAYVRAIGK